MNTPLMHSPQVLRRLRHCPNKAVAGSGNSEPLLPESTDVVAETIANLQIYDEVRRTFGGSLDAHTPIDAGLFSLRVMARTKTLAPEFEVEVKTEAAVNC